MVIRGKDHPILFPVIGLESISDLKKLMWRNGLKGTKNTKSGVICPVGCPETL
jgi:hypothetical protein